MLIPATRAAYLHAVAVQNRLFLGAALVFTSVAAAVTWRERNRRRDLVTPEGWQRPVRPRPKIPLPAAALAVVAAAALAGSIASGALIYDRLGAYNADGIYLRAGHPVRVLLGPDHYVVYVGCTEETICAQLPLSGLSVRTASGGILTTSPDPSSDHLDQVAGEVSFTVPVKEVVSLDLSAHLGQPAFVIASEGEEAHALIGWIILAGLSLLVLLAALASLGVLLARRLGFGGAPVPGAPSAEPGGGRASGAALIDIRTHFAWRHWAHIGHRARRGTAVGQVRGLTSRFPVGLSSAHGNRGAAGYRPVG